MGLFPLRPISIHTPTQGVTAKIAPKERNEVFQSTLPRREWLCQDFNSRSSYEISIHTPTQGVTLPERILTMDSRYFNPHSHAGSDVAQKAVVALIQNFNPHSHAGSDRRHSGSFTPSYLFQSTLPRREWLLKTEKRVSFPYFNPHSHAGSDFLRRYVMSGTYTISIHTPTQGVTWIMGILSWLEPLFQSTLPRREWPGCTGIVIGTPPISIHTPTQGVTLGIPALLADLR